MTSPRLLALFTGSLLAATGCDAPTTTDAGRLDARVGEDARLDAGREPDAGSVDAALVLADAPAAELVPTIFRTPDVNAVCGATPTMACTPGDLAWLASEYGSSYRRADPARVTEAGRSYRLVALVEREGPSNLDVFVVDEAGAALTDVPIAFWYSSAPETSRADEWYPQKVVSRTGADGRAGFALGGGAYLSSCGGGGPHAVWVSEPGAAADSSVPSDVADALGMLGGTNHRHLDLLFQRARAGETPADAVRCPLGL